MLILRSYFCHFASAVVELQWRANTINIPKVKLESSAASEEQEVCDLSVAMWVYLSKF